MLVLIIIFTLIGSIFSLAGGIFLLRQKKWPEAFSIKLVSFAAGVLLTTAFFDLFPEALEESGENSQIFLIMFITVIGFFFLERTFLWFHHHHGEAHGIEPSVYLLLIGDTIHNFIDGVVIAASFMINIPLGILTSLAVAAHEIPQEIADFSILLSQGVSKINTLKYNLLSAIFSLFGALLTYSFAKTFKPYLWIIITITGGMFVYIATADLIPELHQAYRKKRSLDQAFFFLAGILLTLLLVKVLGR